MRFWWRGLIMATAAVAVAGCPSDEVEQGRDTDEATSTSSTTSSSTTSDPTTGPSTNTASQSDSDTTDPTSSTTDSTTTDDPTSTTTDSTGTDSDTDGSTGTTGGGGLACADVTISGAFPLEDTGTIGMGDGDDFEPGKMCSPGTGGFDLAFEFTAPDAGTYVVSTLDSNFDTVLMVYDACDGTLLECNDDIDFDNNVVTSAVAVDLQADETILIVVDGYDASEFGNYTLTIEPQAG